MRSCAGSRCGSWRMAQDLRTPCRDRRMRVRNLLLRGEAEQAAFDDRPDRVSRRRSSRHAVRPLRPIAASSRSPARPLQPIGLGVRHAWLHPALLGAVARGAKGQGDCGIDGAGDRAALTHATPERDRAPATDPRDGGAQCALCAVIASLGGYAVETISKSSAEPVMSCATNGSARLAAPPLSSSAWCRFHAQRAARRRLVSGLWPQRARSENWWRSAALCLEPGACVHYAPRKRLRFVPHHSCLQARLPADWDASLFCLRRSDGGRIWRRLPGGELESTWARVLMVEKGRKRRYFCLTPGAAIPDNPAHWRTTRELRRETRMTFTEARAARLAHRHP